MIEGITLLVELITDGSKYSKKLMTYLAGYWKKINNPSTLVQTGR